MITPRIVPAVVFATLSTLAHADIKLPALFSEHMVLQGGVKVPVWGSADPGEEVSISIGKQTKTTKADNKGKWRVVLDPLKPEQGLELTAKGKNTVTAKDVLIGDVWLCSGQSNMEQSVSNSANPDAEKAAGNFPSIRMFTVPYRKAAEPLEDCIGAWKVCTPENVGSFSATGYFFGRELHQKLGINVGLINSSVGGTAIEAWTSSDAMKGKPQIKFILDRWNQWVAERTNPENIKKHEEAMAAWKIAEVKAKAEGTKTPDEPGMPGRDRLDHNHPANLFNGKIASLIPYPIKGAIWYQGESNANSPEDSKVFAFQLPLMISDWRKRWGNEFPFAWVQLVNFQDRKSDPGAPSKWALIRESMVKALATPKTGMTVNIDIGEAEDIHPKNKQEIGRRLALWALAKVYGQKIPYSGPLYSKHEIKGDKVVVSFTHSDKGLVAKDGELKAFAIAGADKKWVWANAKIEGGKVVISHPEIKQPTAVRYGWAQNPDCNLFNGAGLPASPFRTDSWE